MVWVSRWGRATILVRAVRNSTKGFKAGRKSVTNLKKMPIYELDELLAQMTPDTFHDEVDFGTPVGKECWWSEPSLEHRAQNLKQIFAARMLYFNVLDRRAS
jgi:hypothetical protein